MAPTTPRLRILSGKPTRHFATHFEVMADGLALPIHFSCLVLSEAQIAITLSVPELRSIPQIFIHSFSL